MKEKILNQLVYWETENEIVDYNPTIMFHKSPLRKVYSTIFKLSGVSIR